MAAPALLHDAPGSTLPPPRCFTAQQRTAIAACRAAAPLTSCMFADATHCRDSTQSMTALVSGCSPRLASMLGLLIGSGKSRFRLTPALHPVRGGDAGGGVGRGGAASASSAPTADASTLRRCAAAPAPLRPGPGSVGAPPPRTHAFSYVLSLYPSGFIVGISHMCMSCTTRLARASLFQLAHSHSANVSSSCLRFAGGRGGGGCCRSSAWQGPPCLPPAPCMVQAASHLIPRPPPPPPPPPRAPAARLGAVHVCNVFEVGLRLLHPRPVADLQHIQRHAADLRGAAQLVINARGRTGAKLPAGGGWCWGRGGGARQAGRPAAAGGGGAGAAAAQRRAVPGRASARNAPSYR